jgi:DNA-binding response OmpR family regulator
MITHTPSRAGAPGFGTLAPAPLVRPGIGMTENKKVLVVEDSPETITLIEHALVREGFEVMTATDGERALELVASFAPDLVVLDLVIPKIDGLEVCRQIRATTDAYVIMLTAKTDEVDRVIGLTVGADDYVTKPFFPRELVARVSATLRRQRAVSVEPEVVRVGDLTLDPGAREVKVAGEPVELTKIEFDLLAVLMSKPMMVFTRDMLREQVWGPNWFGDNHVVDVHMANLRKKVGQERPGGHIKTVRGVGFKLSG